MLRKGKKLISKLLFLAICTSLVPTTIAFAEEKDNTKETVTNVIQTTAAAVSFNQSDFKFDTNTGTITKYTGNETEVVIPSEIDGVEVTGIGNGAFSSSGSLSNCITKIVIPDSVTRIGNGAFIYCHNLQSVTIPDSVTSIEDYAFSYCTSLSSIIIPDSVTSIGDNAFSGCNGLMKLTIPNSAISIGKFAFSGCTSLESVTIPDNVTSIGDNAFWACSNLKEISVGDNNINYKSIDGVLYSKDGTELLEYPIGKTDDNYTIIDGVKNIGNDAFCYCSLRNITFPNSLINIGDSAFYDCTNLKSVTIPDGVTSIGFNAFSSCSSLTSVIIPNSVKSIGYNGMDGSMEGYSAFDGCNSTVIFYVESEEIKQLLVKSHISSSRIIIGTGVTIPVIETTVTLNNTILNLEKGESSVLTVTVLSNNTTTNSAVTWESSNTSVAIVDENGKVTAVGVGNATITCTSSDGSGKSAACNVTVTNSLLDRTALNNEITRAQGVVNKLNDAISAAKSVADDSSATETDVNNAAEKLIQAEESLADAL